jgi:hypothetical protein
MIQEQLEFFLFIVSIYYKKNHKLLFKASIFRER